MKRLHINLISKSLFILILFVSLTINTAIGGQYEMSVDNISHINQTEIEFYVTIRGVEDPFNLTSFQIALAIENISKNPDDLQFSYVENSTQLSNVPQYGVHASLTDGLPEVTFAALPGADTISNETVVVGKFRLSSSTTDLSVAGVKWDFEGINSTIILGEGFEDITSPENHIISTITDLDNSVSSPLTFSLSQNYPNPFNPSTVINFSLQKDADVTLSVYNILGQQVTTLINEKMTSGNHSVKFNASNIASGVYFYNINAGDFSETRKMILQK